MRIKFVLLIFLCLCSAEAGAQAQSMQVPRKPLNSRSVVLTRVRGWEWQLVQGNPNLARYYWEPMVRRTINTTAATGPQAVRAPLPVAKVRQERFRSLGMQNLGTQNSGLRNSDGSLVSALLCKRTPPAASHAETDTVLSYHSPVRAATNSATRSSASDSSARLGVSAHLVSAPHSVAAMQPGGLEAHQLSLTSGL
jgi:hypothetical protein